MPKTIFPKASQARVRHVTLIAEAFPVKSFSFRAPVTVSFFICSAPSVYFSQIERTNTETSYLLNTSGHKLWQPNTGKWTKYGKVWGKCMDILSHSQRGKHTDANITYSFMSTF